MERCLELVASIDRHSVRLDNLSFHGLLGRATSRNQESKTIELAIVIPRDVVIDATRKLKMNLTPVA